MHRFYVQQLPDPSQTGANAASSSRLSGTDPTWQEVVDVIVELDADEARHGRRVLRLAEGAQIALFDGRGGEARGVIDAWKPTARVRLTQLRRVPPPAHTLTIAAAMPKGPRADAMIAQLSQLGVSAFIPMRTQRSVVDPRDNKLNRLRRACIESAKQCGRSHVMRLGSPVEFADALLLPAETKHIADAAGQPHTAAPTGDALVLIGPEGGWTDDERGAASDAGFTPWRLGPHILRIETAALAAAAILSRLQ